MTLAEFLFSLLVYPGLLFALAVGGMFYWLYRKVRARMQSRVGPPWFQYFVDLIKLFSKESIIPSSGRAVLMVLSPAISIVGLLLTIAILPLGSEPLVRFEESLLVALYFLAFPGLAMIMAGSSSGSPYGIVGASREARMMISEELPFTISALTVAFYLRSLSLESIVQYQLSNGIFLFKFPFAAAAFLICLLPKIGRRPFDAPEADTEIIGGPLTEYSGVPLGLFEIVNAVKWFVAPAFGVVLFLGGGASLAEYLLKCLGLVLIVSFIDVIHPRFRIDQGVGFFMKWILPLSMIDLVRSLILL
ncbi:MAG: complex I subunit 1 family protein [Candidatus Bathyarchaeia archaeon]